MEKKIADGSPQTFPKLNEIKRISRLLFFRRNLNLKNFHLFML